MPDGERLQNCLARLAVDGDAGRSKVTRSSRVRTAVSDPLGGRRRCSAGAAAVSLVPRRSGDADRAT